MWEWKVIQCSRHQRIPSIQICKCFEGKWLLHCKCRRQILSAANRSRKLRISWIFSRLWFRGYISLWLFRASRLDIEFIGRVRKVHCYFFKELIEIYIKQLKEPNGRSTLMPLIRDLYVKLFTLTQGNKSQTLFQKSEAKILYEEYLRSIPELVGPEVHSWIISESQN